MEKEQGGRGTLLGGVPGVMPSKTVIIGGGVVGANAGAHRRRHGIRIIVIDRSLDVLRRLDDLFASRLKTIFSTHHSIERQVTSADLVIGAVLIPGAAAPKLITTEMVQKMENRAR